MPPPEPIISVEHTEESVHFQLSSPYLWADYEESNYNVTLMKVDDSSILMSHLISSANNGFVSINLDEVEMLPIPIQPCSEYMLYVRLFSPVFGHSVPSMLKFIVPSEGNHNILKPICINIMITRIM